MNPRFLTPLALLLVLVLATPALAASALAAPPVPAGSGTATLALSAKQAQAAAARARLDVMRSDLARKLGEFQKLDFALVQTRAAVASATAELDSLDALLATQQPALDARADHLYRDGQHQDLVSVILGTTSFDDFVSRIDFLVMLSRHDAQLIEDVKTARERQAEAKGSLQKRETQLAGLRAGAATARAQVQAAVDEQQKSLDGLNAEVAQLVRDGESAKVVRAASLAPAPTVPIPNGGTDWLDSRSLLLPTAWGVVQGVPGRFRIPATAATTYRRTGIAFDWVSSTYGNADNAPTPTSSASSRPYNENELTCANKTLPFGTLLAVSYGGKQAIVVVTDRGPYVSGRSLDLSTAAAREIGLPGVAPVHVEIVVPAS